MGNSNIRNWRTGLAVAIAIALPLTVSARQHRERDADDPGARAQAMDEWYNESYSSRGVQPKSHQKKALFSPQYERFLMQAAKRERVRYGRKLPASNTSKMMMDPSAVLPVATGGNWLNIGPTKADFTINGVTLHVTDSGRVNAIVTDPDHPNTIYVAYSGGGLWKSTDGGAFWQAKTETLGSLSIGSLAMDPNDANTLYVGLGDPFDGTGIGLVKSTDGGDNWTDPVFLGTSTVISDIKVAQTDSSVVLAATNKGLYRSTNGGTSFTNISIVPTGGGVPVVWSIAAAGGTNFVLSLLGGTSDGEIWRSTDNGATWTKSTGIASGVGRISVDAAPSRPSVLYATAAKPSGSVSTDLVDIYKSVDDGLTWTGIAKSGSTFKTYTNSNGESSTLSDLLRGQGWYNHMTLVDRTNPGIAYFGGALLLAKTTDGGATFSQTSNWLAQFGLPYVHADFHAGHISSNGTLYVGTDGGIFASSNRGVTFTDTLNEGIASHLVYQLGSSTNNPDAVIIGLQDNGTRVRDSNTSVFNQEIGGDGFGCNINQADATKMLGSLYYDRIFKSTNGGATFSSASSGIAESNNSNTAPFVTVLSPWAGDATGNTIYTYSNAKVYKTTNYATSWTALGITGLTQSSLFIRGVSAAPSNANVVGVVANGGRVFLTSDGGANWTLATSTPNNGLSMSRIAFDQTDSNIVYVSSVAPDQTKTHLWRSTDFGTTWTAIDLGASGFPAGIPVNTVLVDPVTHTTLYAGTHLGVYRSTDSGSSWSRYGSGMPLVSVTNLYVASDDSLVRAATYGRSVWELTQNTTNAAPTAAFSSTPTGFSAAFTDSSTDGDGSISSRAWNFGDDTAVSHATNPTHLYSTGGTYKVSLSVTDNGGATSTVSHPVVITAPAMTTYRLAPGSVIHSGVSDSTINVSGRVGNGQANTRVNVFLQYPHAGDLQISLVAPDSSVHLLKATSTSTVKLLSASYVVDLSSIPLNGDWKLRINDTTSADDGVLKEWDITF
jgi:PKD repeat protein